MGYLELAAVAGRQRRTPLTEPTTVGKLGRMLIAQLHAATSASEQGTDSEESVVAG